MPKTLRAESIENAIYTIRGVRVMLDADLAAFYGVETKRLLEQVRRNTHRFPKDFGYQLDAEEFENLRSQIATSRSHGGRRTLPWVFTEHGAVMLASVLNSKTAIDASVAIVRAFVQIQKTARLSGGELIAKLAQIDGRLNDHDGTFEKVLEALDLLLNPTTPAKEMGFHTLMEDPEVCTNLANLPRKAVRYTVPKRARKEKK